MDTLDAKNRIMNEIDSIDVQVQAMHEKVSELHNRKNQYKDAYTSIVSAERQAEHLLAGLLKAADLSESEVAESEVVAEDANIWEASAEDAGEKAETTESKERFDPLQVLDQEISMSEDESPESEGTEKLEDESEPSEVNGKQKGTRQIPSFLRQYL